MSVNLNRKTSIIWKSCDSEALTKNWYKIAKESASFLSTPEQAWEWAKENVDVEVTEDTLQEDLLSDSERAILEIQLDNYQEKAALYSNKYNQIKNAGRVVVYRGVRVVSMDDIDWSNIGTHWSFEKSGAGVYGEVRRHVRRRGLDVLLTGLINAEDIDWEYSFTSFMYYGEEQWECSLNDGATVIVTHINDEKLSEPIRAEAWNVIG